MQRALSGFGPRVDLIQRNLGKLFLITDDAVKKTSVDVASNDTRWEGGGEGGRVEFLVG